MSDWPAQALENPTSGCICSNARGSIGGEFEGAASNSVWPAANRAIYIPFYLNRSATVYQMGFEVATQSGNCDVGIYDINGVRLVSAGSTAVGAAGFQAVDIANTSLGRGTYYMAMCVDNTTASFAVRLGASGVHLTTLGVKQQAVGAVTLPDPATFANPASTYNPSLSVYFVATI